MTIKLRDYQQAAIDYLYDYFSKKQGNPVIAMPTGTGKSLVIGEFTRSACLTYPGTRILMLTHVKELIEQNLKALTDLWPTAPAGIYSAGLGQREHRTDITYAGIQSVHRKPEIFGHIDLVAIDECHLVSPRSETMYGRFLDALRAKNSALKVVGFSATPYRMKHGMLTDDDGLFDDVAFDLTSRDAFNWMISQGWIAPLVPKQTGAELDVSGVKMQGGEFVLSDLQAHVDHEEITIAALKEAVQLASDRKHWLVFASGITHAEHISDYLESVFGISASVVHSQMSNTERDTRINDFKQGRIRALVNNNILTTGFDFPAIDCIVMLRPTASPGLWVQMLGRGTRPVPGKRNCLVLDFAGNTKRLGPINDPVLPRKRGKGPAGMAPVRLCEACGCYSHASARFCENVDCGIEFPRGIKIMSQASMQDIIAGLTPKIETYGVDLVTYQIHKKEGKPDSMRVTYHCGLRRFKEYICLDHGGYATRVARQWWEMRSPWGVPPSVHEGMKAIDYLRVPRQINVAEKGKYPEICGYSFNGDKV
jgi:DNA repair protein RadD